MKIDNLERNSWKLAIIYPQKMMIFKRHGGVFRFSQDVLVVVGIYQNTHLSLLLRLRAVGTGEAGQLLQSYDRLYIRTFDLSVKVKKSMDLCSAKRWTIIWNDYCKFTVLYKKTMKYSITLL